MQRDLHAPRIVVASGMACTGVSTVAAHMQDAAPTLNVVDGGSHWADVLEACTPGFARMIVVTTHDIVAISSAYALIKLVRDRFPDSPIEVLVNRSEERDALRTYERVQGAVSRFLNEMVGFAGSVPECTDVRATETAPTDLETGAGRATMDRAVVMALHDLAIRLDEEMELTVGRGALRPDERRMA